MPEPVRRALLASVLLCALGAVAAEPPAVPALSFDEAVRRALENNHDVAQAATAILRADAILGKARAAILPTLVAYAAEGVIDESITVNGIEAQPRDQLSVGATLTVPVLTAARWAQKTHAADRVEVARLQAAEVRRQVAVAAGQAYLAVIAAHRQVEIDERARDNAQAQYDFAQTRFDAGAGTRLDASRAADVLASNQVLVERSRLALTLAQEGLGVLLAAEGPIDAAAEPVFEVPPREAEPDLSIRSDLRLHLKEREAAERVLRDSWKDYLPELVASFDPLYVDPAGAFQDSSSWRAVLALSFPIYLGGERGADKDLRAAALQSATISLDQTELRARAEVRSARAAMESAERGLLHARQAAERANEVLGITDKAFRAGARTNIELVDAQRRARDAETAVGRAEDVLRQAKLELLAALGLFGN